MLRDLLVECRDAYAFLFRFVNVSHRCTDAITQYF